MMQFPNDPKKVAEAAMQFELEGHRILLESAEKAKDALSMATFKFLADQELKHIEAIKAFAEALGTNAEFDFCKLCTAVSKEEALREIQCFFAEYESEFENISADESRLQVYEVAMNMEDNGYQFYKCAAENETDPASRKFYEFLAAEEIKHFEIIQDTHDFLKQPDAFLAIEEHWMTL